MTTKQQLIEQAAAEFGISSSFDIPAEKLQEGLARLNRIAAMWDGKGIRVGFNLGGGLADSAGIPDTCENAFALALAVQWAASFGKMVSVDTKVAAKDALNALMISRRTMPEVPYPPGLPVGTGSRIGVMGRQYFPATTEVPGLNDGATEY